MIRINLTSVIDLLTDSLRYIVLMLVLLWLIGAAVSIGV
jgi:hypothetical protein